MRKVYIENGSLLDTRLFREMGYEVVHSLERADLLHLVGGADVDPRLYNAIIHPMTSFDVRRDLACKVLVDKAVGMGIPVSGICRGGQYLNVYNGGQMIQHVLGHANGKTHEIHTSDFGVIEASSTHHQVMIPHITKARVLAYAQGVAINKEIDHPNNRDLSDTEAEVVFYPEHRHLCFQPHPEFMPLGHPCPKYFEHCINTALFTRH